MKNRLRVLLVAYACDPSRGSEPGAGWALVVAAAKHCDVTVITRGKHVAGIRKEVELRSLRVAVQSMDGPLSAVSGDTRWHALDYAFWLARVAVWTRRQRDNFDRIHQVTFAADWMPPLPALLAPRGSYLWGPVGGVAAPMRPHKALFKRLEYVKESAINLIRDFGRLAARVLVRMRKVSVIAQNEMTGNFFGEDTIAVEPNVCLFPVSPRATLKDLPSEAWSRAPVRLLQVGRLKAYKGLQYSFEALLEPSLLDAHLLVAGEGKDRQRLESKAEALGISNRVHFVGNLSREVLWGVYASAHVGLLPSIREGAPWVVGEAGAYGLPVVVFDRCGAKDVAIRGQHSLIDYQSQNIASDIALATSVLIKTTKHEHVSSPKLWSAERFDLLLPAWYSYKEQP